MRHEDLVVVLHPEADQQITEDLLAELDNRNRRLPDFKRVAGYVRWDEDFPRTASMKIKRHVLAETLRLRLDRQAAVVKL
jgi:acyl-coenzyme A synthetase/AMP-(fatty) acid ligase